jgi:hypothetical protein
MDTQIKNGTIINNVISSHKETANFLLNAARHFMQAAWFQRMGEYEKALASATRGRKNISQANEVQGECLLMPA